MHRRCFLLFVLLSVATRELAVDTSPFTLHTVAEAPNATTKEHQLPHRHGGTPETVLLNSAVLLDHQALKSVKAEQEDQGGYRILLEFTKEGAKQFGQITRKNIGKRLAIVLDGKLQSSPLVHEAIEGGSAAISGSFTEEEAEALVAKVQSAIRSQGK